MAVTPRKKLGASPIAEPAVNPQPETVGADGAEDGYLPPDCPAIPLGYSGHYVYVLDYVGQFHKINARHEIGRTTLLNVCPSQWLYKNYPRLKEVLNKQTGKTEWLTVGWRPEKFGEALDNSCKRLGFFDESELVRGRGAHEGENGELILHLGNALWQFGKKQKTGRRGEYIYPSLRPLPGPANGPIDVDLARRLMEQIAGSWNFGRAIDPFVCVGMLGAIILGGALPVRPGWCVTGERGTGKTELMRFINAILGKWLIYTTDSTEAGLRQHLGRDAVGVLMDEQESTADNSAFRRVQLYWRASYSGGQTLRGGQDHSGAAFIARSVVIMAAINIPAMDSADRSRVIVTDIQPLPAGPKPRLIHDALWPDIGAKLIRRLADHYKRLIGEIIPRWRELLIDAGWDDRGADTYGVIFGCASALLADELPDEDIIAQYRDDLDALALAHKTDETPSWRAVLGLIWGWRADQYRRGEVRSLGEYATEAFGWGREDATDGEWTPYDANAIKRTEKEARADAERNLDAKKAAQLLRRYGIKTITAPDDDPRGAWKQGERLIAFANSAHGMADIFAATPWQSTPSGQGGWSAALLRAPLASRWPMSLRFPFGPSRVVVMRLDTALSGLVGPDPDGEASAWNEMAQGAGA